MRDLFPEFEQHTIEGDGAEIHLRAGGSGPPLLLVHGYPQCHAMWHRIAPDLAQHFSLVIPDLRGYGRSSCPANGDDNFAYSKRAMGRDFFAVMSALGHDRFMVCGHDRGGRVAYRMALDGPNRITKLAVLDIVTTYDTWQAYDASFAMDGYHWQFLAQPYPMPETLIGADPAYYLEYTLASWTASGDLACFADAALDDYRSAFADPKRVHAMCNDYRAGWSYDWTTDKSDFEQGRRITCPMNVQWGSHGIPGKASDGPLDLWKVWCDEVSGGEINAGHFLAEENPQATVDGLLSFLVGP